MKKTRKKSTDDDSNVYLAFSPIDAISFHQARASVEEIVKENFEDSCCEMYQSSDECELVYSIAKPVSHNDESLVEFFTKIESVFHATSSMRPRFIQYYEGDKK